jgi:hypothetical protein
MFGRVRMYEAWDEASIIVFRVVRVLHDSGERTRHRLDLPGMIALGSGFSAW